MTTLAKHAQVKADFIVKDAENSKLNREINELKEAIQDATRMVDEQSQETGVKEAAVEDYQRKLEASRKKAALLESAVMRLESQSFRDIAGARSQSKLTFVVFLEVCICS